MAENQLFKGAVPHIWPKEAAEIGILVQLDKGAVPSAKSTTAPNGGFIPYPNPRYAMSGGMQSMSGGA
jgi:hypothetical protein